jgi:hypothetical protein
MQQPQTKKANFNKTQKEWYKKLKESGFHDIEYKDGSVEQAVPNYLRRRKDVAFQIESVQAYYRLAEHFLNEHKFKDNIEKAIWEYHANGLSIRETCAALKTARVKKCSRSKIGSIVQHLVKTMKARYLLP